jgi:predicted phage terminase large subunit-like protein
VSDSDPLNENELVTWRFLEELTGPDGILDYIPQVSPGYSRPDHLYPLADFFAKAKFSPQRCWISVPPRHSKTETIMHALAHWLMVRPHDPLVYITYEANLAYNKSRRIRDIAQAMGVQLRSDSKAVNSWQTTSGIGGLRATGIGGPLTGSGAQVLVVDDPVKNREEAESAVIRQKTWDWFTSTALTRIEPGGSVLVCHTRWHDDDLIGRLKEDPNWVGIELPAIEENPDGTPKRVLWPSRWPLKELEVKRREVGEYDWASLYQCQPRPRGGRMFSDPDRYTALTSLFANPDLQPKIIIGVDPAATEKTSADYSAAVVLACSGRFATVDFRADVLEVLRIQAKIPDLVVKLKDLARKWGAPIAVEAVGGFKAVPDLLRRLDPSLKVIEVTPLGDKFTRALPVAAAWNDGRVRVPDNADWLHDFVTEVTKFTGVKDPKDDQVDALAHAFNAAQTLMPSGTPPLTKGPRRAVLPFA